jgi:hypothetical protein
VKTFTEKSVAKKFVPKKQPITAHAPGWRAPKKSTAKGFKPYMGPPKQK